MSRMDIVTFRDCSKSKLFFCVLEKNLTFFSVSFDCD